MPASQQDKAERFRALHLGPCFVIPNPWDGGSARALEGLGFEARATSSAAAAGLPGRRDGKLTREEALALHAPSSPLRLRRKTVSLRPARRNANNAPVQGVDLRHMTRGPAVTPWRKAPPRAAGH